MNHAKRVEKALYYMSDKGRALVVFYLLGRFWLEFSEGDAEHMEKRQKQYPRDNEE